MTTSAHTMRFGGALLLGILALSTVTGCQPTYTDFSAFVREPQPLVTGKAYTIAPPDVVLVESKRVREIDGHQEQVRSDGKITLPLFGEIFVAGKTPKAISDELQVLAQEYYEDADVTVRVTGYKSKQIFVFGEVSAPGPYAYTGSNTVLKTLSMAQPTRLADPGKIQVLRPNADGELRRRMTIDLDEMVKHGDTTLDAPLEDGDIIFVPANGFASVGLALQQVLLPLQPAVSVVNGPGDLEEGYDNSFRGGSVNGAP